MSGQRNKGVVIAPRVNTGEASAAADHSVRFYAGDEFPADAVAEFLLAARGDSAIAAIGTAGHLTAIDAALRARGVAVDAVELVDVDALLATATTREARAAAVTAVVHDRLRRRGRARIYGEVVDIVSMRGDIADAVALEHTWNDLLRERPIALLCGHCIDGFVASDGPRVYADVCRAHGTVTHDALPPGDVLAAAYIAERERSEELAGRMGSLLAMLGHELRNPLAPIATGLELMKATGSPEFRREREMMERQVEHLTRLLDDLHDASRITRGSIEIERVRVRLASVISEALHEVEPLLAEGRHVVAVALPDEDVAVMGDAYRLRQVFTNLLSNAAKFTARGARVDIASSVRRDRVSVAISDDGEGMEPSRVASVFEPFAQGSQALERSRGGLGLGLPIARAIVELHGGSLTARSDGEGRGSRFTVRLPLAGPHGIVEAAEQAPTDRLASLSRQRVLVVDDNQDAADMLGALLRNAGFEVDVAYDGPAALAAADIARPDVAILDIGLPTMDGYELARKLRERTGDRPPRLVALTGYGHTEAKERSRAAGFAAHIVKPVDTHRLRELVEALAD